MVDTNTAEVVETTETDNSKKTFFERAPDMNLLVHHYGHYSYTDALSDVIYKQLKTITNDHIPHLGIFCKCAGDEHHKFIGIVSDNYNFIGHEIVNNILRDAITSVGSPTLRENTLLSTDGSQMLTEIILEHRNNMAEVGDVYPQLRITNGYNGNRAVNVSFGIHIHTENYTISTGFKKFGEVRQVHNKTHKTTLSSAIGSYIARFNSGIQNLLTENFRHTLTEDDLLKILDTIEKLGTKRRTSISSVLDETIGPADSENRVISRWDLFLAIVRFSSIEKNLNIKLLLENIAERCLNFPVQMENVLSQLNDA